MRWFGFLVLGLLAVGVGYWKHSQNIQQQEAVAEQARLERPRTDEEIRRAIRQSLAGSDSLANTPDRSAKQNVPTATAAFICDGREHCSDMRSYEEAKFFINNCPNTKMDGDRDGEPCEDQF